MGDLNYSPHQLFRIRGPSIFRNLSYPHPLIPCIYLSIQSTNRSISFYIKSLTRSNPHPNKNVCRQSILTFVDTSLIILIDFQKVWSVQKVQAWEKIPFTARQMIYANKRSNKSSSQGFLLLRLQPFIVFEKKCLTSIKPCTILII